MIRLAAPLVLLLAACTTTPGGTATNLHVLQDAEREFILEQYLQSAGHYEAFLAYNPQYERRSHVRVMAGRAYLGSGRVDQAITAFDRAIAEAPEPAVRWDAVFHRAIAYRQKGELSRAVDAFRSVATAPAGERGGSVTHDELHYEFALALFRSGDWRGGQGELGLVGPRGPFAAKARMRLGLTSFSVQLGAYADDARARLEAERSKGIVRGIPGDKPLFAVTYGSFARYEDAQREADRLKRQYPDAFVIP